MSQIRQLARLPFMTTQSVALFTHIVGVLALFVALALEWMSVELLRRSGPAGPPPFATDLFRRLPRVTGLALGLILVSGMYMAITFGLQRSPWVGVSLASMVLIGGLGGAARRRRASNAFLRVSLRMRIGIALAVVYLMVTKPAPLESAAIVVAALIAGAGAGIIGARSPSAAAFADQNGKAAARATAGRGL